MTDITELDPPTSPNGKEMLVPRTRRAWRDWLSANAERDEGVWLVYRKKRSAIAGPDYDDLVEEALCFGWIDSVVRPAEDDRRIQWFSPRRKGGIWSALNKQRIERLVADGQMSERGQRVIDEAVADGSWSQFDDVDALIVPADLTEALAAAPGAKTAFESLSDSQKKQHLWHVVSAKRAETRSNRIRDLVQELSTRD